jgi:CYTH domain-containing protein
MYNGFQYIIDTFLNIKGGFSILRVKLEDKNQKHTIPDFLKVVRDVTDEQGYKSKYLSKKNWYVPEEDEPNLTRNYKLSMDEN